VIAFSARRPRASKLPLHRRVTVLLWALAFVLGTVGEGFGAHRCPHHDGGSAHSAASADAHAGHHNAAAHPQDSGDGAAAASPRGDDHSSQQSHDGPCTCGSVCQAGAGAALPGVGQAEPTAVVAPANASATPAAAAAGISRPPFFLPLAQAPPRLG
jgi:hypothetical protein